MAEDMIKFIEPIDAALLGLIFQVRGSMRKRLIKRLSPEARILIDAPFLKEWKRKADLIS